MTGRRQHYGVESLHPLGHRVKTAVLTSATKDAYVDENYFAICNSLSMYSTCKKIYISPICVNLYFLKLNFSPT
jgi:hypothetical protein